MPYQPCPNDDLVEVRLEDLLLGVAPLHLARRRLLAQLAQRAHVPPIDDVGMHVADELLRDRAGATRIALHRVLQRARDADHVDAVVLIESLILDGDEGLANVARQRAEGDQRSFLAPDFADERAVAREHQRRLRGHDDTPRIVRLAFLRGSRAGERSRHEQERRQSAEARSAARRTWAMVAMQCVATDMSSCCFRFVLIDRTATCASRVASCV